MGRGQHRRGLTHVSPTPEGFLTPPLLARWCAPCPADGAHSPGSCVHTAPPSVPSPGSCAHTAPMCVPLSGCFDTVVFQGPSEVCVHTVHPSVPESSSVVSLAFPVDSLVCVWPSHPSGKSRASKSPSLSVPGWPAATPFLQGVAESWSLGLECHPDPRGSQCLATEVLGGAGRLRRSFSVAPRIPVPVQRMSQEECSTVETQAGSISWAHLPCPGLPLLTATTSAGWLLSLSSMKRSPWSSGSPRGEEES